MIPATPPHTVEKYKINGFVMIESSDDTPNIATSGEEIISLEFQSMCVDEGDKVQNPENKDVNVKEICGDDPKNKNKKVDNTDFGLGGSSLEPIQTRKNVKKDIKYEERPLIQHKDDTRSNRQQERKIADYKHEKRLKLLVTQLSPQSTSKDIENYFGSFGKIEDINILTQDNKHSAFVVFSKLISPGALFAKQHKINGETVHAHPNIHLRDTIRQYIQSHGR